MIRAVTTFFGVGLLPMAPGTFGSLAALPFGLLLTVWGGPLALMLGAGCVFLLGLWATERHTKGGGDHDPSEIVIDEVVGQWIAMAPLAMNIGFFGGDLFIDLFVNLGLSFVLFRVFDITKPFPVSRADRMATPMGVMLDDVLAGIMAAIGLTALVAIFS